MNCPGCGKEMTAGVVRATGQVFFFDEEYADLRWKPGEHAVLLTSSNMISPISEDAWCCRNCKKVVIDYADIPQSNLKNLL